MTTFIRHNAQPIFGNNLPSWSFSQICGRDHFMVSFPGSDVIGNRSEDYRLDEQIRDKS